MCVCGGGAREREEVVVNMEVSHHCITDRVTYFHDRLEHRQAFDVETELPLYLHLLFHQFLLVFNHLKGGNLTAIYP